MGEQVTCLRGAAGAVLQRDPDSESKEGQAKQPRSADYYRSLIEDVLDVITVVDAEGTILFQSPSIERVLGYRPEELIGRSAVDFVHPDDLPGLRRAMARGIPITGPTAAVEFRIRHKDGSWRIFEGIGKNLIDNPAVAGVVTVSRDITERKRAENTLIETQQALERNREELRALTARLFTAHEEERRRLSRELHDDLNQRLAFLAVEVESLLQHLGPDNEVVRQRLEDLEAHVVALSEDVRHMAHQLHPSILDDLGLVPALRAYCGDFSRREGIRVRFAHKAVPEHVPQETALCLYRVTQEALRNVARHSRSVRAAVALVGTQEGIRLSIRDLGVGFDPSARAGKGGLGIISMEERVRLAQGTISVVSQPGHGTRIEIRIPISGRPQ